jgi:phospholipid transport system substrate-binding protein
MRIASLFLAAALTASPVLFAPLAKADPGTQNPLASTSAQQTPAAAFIQNLGDQAITVMANKGLTAQQRTQKYNIILHDSFDLPTIGHFVLGRAWTTATPEQQKEFMRLFSQMVLESYGDRLNFYSGEGFEVKGARQENDKDSVVESQIKHPNGAAPTEIDWRVRDQNGKLGVIDVVIEGVSQSVTQRQEYAAIIQRNNGNLDGLLEAMRQRLQKPQ